MRRILAAISLTLFASLAHASAPQIAVTIKPLHSLVAAVTDGVTEPDLLLTGNESPHTYSLRPSDAQTLSRADIIVWIGPGLETFLIRPLNGLAADATSLSVAELSELTWHAARSGGGWESHTHHSGNHDGHSHDHEHGDSDYHVWLDPHNAMAIVRAVRDTLAESDPAHADRYHANAERALTRLRELDATLERRLTPIAEVPYLVFHDAYQYLERRYGTNVVGSVTVSPERAPGARRLSELRERIRTEEVRCVFREPQFEPRLMHTLLEGTGARAGTLDPLGGTLEPGPDAYFELMDQLATALHTCLADAE